MNKVNISHLKTIYKGCANDGTITDPSKSFVVRLSNHDANSHATLMSMLSPAFLQAQQLADENVSNDPFHITILFHKDTNQKRKEENKETIYETLIWFLENFLDPANGAIVSVYRAHDSRFWQGNPWTHNKFWPLKRRWNPQDSHVSVHLAEPLMSVSRKAYTLKHEKEVMPIIKRLSEKLGYEIKYVDYTCTTEEIVSVMETSDYHFAYNGATMYTAAMIGIPCLAWHHHGGITYETDDWRDYNNLEIIHTAILQKESPWGKMSTSPGKIQQYNFEKQRVEVYPLYNNKLIETNTDIIEAFREITLK